MPKTQQIFLSLFCLVTAVSCIHSPYPKLLILQHLPTGLAVVGLTITAKRWPLSNLSFVCILGFLLLHVVGARYIYSYVPYDDWLETLLGFRLGEVFGWRRNHYDRFVHFAFGGLAVYPLYEVSTRYLNFSHRTSLLLVVQFILASSALYELGEWVLAIVMAPDWAEAYNGQQGDLWDAQKDMALALGGSLLTTSFLWQKREWPTAPRQSCNAPEKENVG